MFECGARATRTPQHGCPQGATRKWDGPPLAGLRSALADALGYPNEAALPWDKLREVFTCHIVHGKALPAGLKRALVDAELDAAAYDWAVWYDDDRQLALAASSFLGELLGALDSAVAVQIFSGHDSTVVPTLAALECNDGFWYGWPLAFPFAGVGSGFDFFGV